jgi:hypothetical protein
MARPASAAARPRAARRITNIFAIVAAVAIVLVAVPVEPLAQTGGAPPIRIPPAQLPPLAAAPSPVAPVAPAKIDPAPRALLPARVQVLRDLNGSGMAMYGALNGTTASATGVVLAIFANSGAFDPTPVVQLMTADESDRHAQALFTATVHGTPVTGIAIAALSEAGGDVTVFYDNTDAFAASFARMQQTLAEGPGVQTVALSPSHLDDGSEIGLPLGWRVMTQGVDAVDLQGPQGEFISLGAAMPVYAGDIGADSPVLQAPCCDPRATFEMLFPKIAAAFQRRGFPAIELAEIVETRSDEARNSRQGTLILGNLQVGGEAYGYFAAAAAVASLTDPWTFTLSGAMAPQPIFAAEFPALMQIWNSYRAVHPTFGLNLKLPQAVRGMSATEAMLASSLAARETTEYNASPGWSQVIAAITKPEPAQINEAIAQPLVDRLSSDAGRRWRIVPQAAWK